MNHYDRLRDNKSDWSDNSFLETYFNKRKVKKIDPACWKSHIISFLNDMYSNEVSNAYHRKSHLALILMLPHPTKTKLLFEEYINDSGYNSDRPANGEILNITQGKHSMFFGSVRKYLACDSIEDKHFTALRVALGIVALVCLRSTVKSINAVKNFFFHEFQSTMKLLYPNNLNCIKELPLPSSAFFKDLPMRCNKRDSEIKDTLILLLGVYTSEKKKNLQADYVILDILNHCILQAVRLNGLGVIMLLEKVSHIYQVDIHKVIESIYPIQPVAEPDFDEPEDIFKNFTSEKWSCYLNNSIAIENNSESTAVHEFYSKYMANDSLEISWPWCRLIDDSYFYTCTIKDNRKSLILAAIVSLNEPDIWNMSVLKEKHTIAKEIAMKEAIEYDKLFRRVS